MQIDSDDIIQIIITVFCSVLASSGFWAYLTSRSNKDNCESRLMRGIAHNLIIQDGMRYINRGYITKDEYADFMKYLYEPYESLGGNGLAKRVFDQVKNLPLRSSPPTNDELDILNSKRGVL